MVVIEHCPSSLNLKEALSPRHFVELATPQDIIPLLSSDLARSHGRALFCVHGTNQNEQYFLAQSYKSSGSEAEKYLYASKNRSEFHAYLQEFVRLLMAAERANLPIIMMIEGDSFYDEDWHRTDKKVSDALTNTINTLVRHGYELPDHSSRIFFVVTYPTGPQPLGYDERPYTALWIFTSGLKDAGLTRPVVAGTCFGGVTNWFTNIYNRAGVYPYHMDHRIAEIYQKEREARGTLVDGRDRPEHPFELIVPRACVGLVLERFAVAGIRPAVARGATYPQIMPKSSELNVEANMVESFAKRYISPTPCSTYEGTI
jgi:hypothetical protein